MPKQIFILQVEDDHDDVDLLQNALRDNGISFSMDVVREGNKALPWLEKATVFPDVIVMDLNLPRMHGKDILAALKASEKFRQIPVVILTTSCSKDERTYCLASGAAEFITKPATVEGFNRAVGLIVAVAAGV